MNAFRKLCGDLLKAYWPHDRAAAQQVSDLLDATNELLRGSEKSVPPQQDTLQDDLYFNSHGKDLGNWLQIKVDPTVFQKSRKNAVKSSYIDKNESSPSAKRRRFGSQIVSRLQRPRTPAVWNLNIQVHLATALRHALSQPGSPGPGSDAFQAQPLVVARFAAELKTSGACEQIRSLGTSLANVCATLQVGGYEEPEHFLSELKADCLEAAEIYLALQNPATRRGRVTSIAESFVNLVASQLDQLITELGITARNDMLKNPEKYQLADQPSKQEAVAVPITTVSLPTSILANREPFKHGDWRKTPYVPRPYERLKAYHIVEEAAREVIERKLRTKKMGGCDGTHCTNREGLGSYNVEAEGFVSGCTCLQRNTECDSACACSSEVCLNRAVTNRKTLVMGVDVDEVDSWGMDCYTRRNILDAVLESQAFGAYEMPDFTSFLKATALIPRTGGMTTRTAREVVSATEVDDISAPQSAETNGIIGAIEETLVAAALGPVEDKPPPTPEQQKQKNCVEKDANTWIEQVLLPAIHNQGENGWDIFQALAEVRLSAEANGDAASASAAAAVENRARDVGYNYFRLHPKGTGLICRRPGGLPRLTFVEEYFGEIHCPWRWFELQDAVKKITGDELPDFYNIVLERPKDDPDGYDVLFVDAAAKGAIASRMSHSCTPNCQAIVMASGGRLTIALYTLRAVHEGEELTFDYSSVTESEKEFREAICLCSTNHCRGSYLCFTGSRAFQQIMNEKHNMLHRQALIVRACNEPLVQEDRDRLGRHSIKASALGSEDSKDLLPDWVHKWAALVCEYIELEESCLKAVLLKERRALYNEASAAAEARGVAINRVQNVVITLDKLKMFLQTVPGQPQDPMLRLLNDQEVADYLWNDNKSIAKKILRGTAQILAPASVSRQFTSAFSNEEIELVAAQRAAELPPMLIHLCGVILGSQAADAAAARDRLLAVARYLREIDVQLGGGLTAVADVTLLYAYTQRWFTGLKGYKGCTSPPVPINLEDLYLNRSQAQLISQQQEMLQHGMPSDQAQKETEEKQKAAAKAAARAAVKSAKSAVLCKVYRPMYAWGQLSSWFKQTVNDPTATLSAERRGTISLPDIESCFGGKVRYTMKERNSMIDTISKKPDNMWRTGTLWSFKNEQKVYGSPHFDAAWKFVGGEGHCLLKELLEELENAVLPARALVTSNSSRSSGGRGSKGGSRGRGRGRGRRSLSMEDSQATTTESEFD